MTVLVVGATGQVGGAVVRELSAARVPFRALVRSPEKADDLRGYDAEIAIGDLEHPESLDDALRGISAAFLVTPSGPRQPDLEGAFADAAARATERPHVVKVAALGWEKGQTALSRWHREAVERLVSAGQPHTVLAPNYFMQNLLAGANSIGHGVLAQPAVDEPIGWVDARDIAAVAAHILQNPAPHEGRSYVITGPEALTYQQVADHLAAARGRAVRYQPASDAEVRRWLLAAGLPEYRVDALAELTELQRTGGAAVVTDEVTKATGRPARSIQDFARDHAAAFHSV